MRCPVWLEQIILSLKDKLQHLFLLISIVVSTVQLPSTNKKALVNQRFFIY